MRISTIKYTVTQGLRNIAKNKMFSIASVATMAACIFLFGVFYSIIVNFTYIVEKVEEDVAVVVFMEGATEDEMDEIGKKLEKHDKVLEIKYVSADEGWEEFQKEYFGEDADIAEGFTENPLEGVNCYEVYMTSVDYQEEVVRYAEGLDGVSEVSKNAQVAETMSSVNLLIAYVSGAIILILLIVAIFLIGNTVTMGITIRREEIAIMKYIGAKDAFVKAPFVLEGVLIGVIGAAIPLLLLYFAYDKTINYLLTRFSILNTLLDFLPASEVYKTLLPVGLLLGVGIGFIGSFFTIKKHLKV